MSQRTTPPFRADHVGSLLRTAPIKEARAKHARGAITRRSSKRSKTARSRRSSRSRKTSGSSSQPMANSAARGGISISSEASTASRLHDDGGIQFHGVQTKAEGIKITGKMGFSGHPMLEHFKFLKAHTRVTPKMTIPAPSHCISARAAR